MPELCLDVVELLLQMAEPNHRWGSWALAGSGPQFNPCLYSHCLQPLTDQHNISLVKFQTVTINQWRLETWTVEWCADAWVPMIRPCSGPRCRDTSCCRGRRKRSADYDTSGPEWLADRTPLHQATSTTAGLQQSTSSVNFESLVSTMIWLNDLVWLKSVAFCYSCELWPNFLSWDLHFSTALTLWRPLLPYGYSYKASCVTGLSRHLLFLTSGHWASACPDVKNYKWRLNPVWHRMLYSCTHMATVGVNGLTYQLDRSQFTSPLPSSYGVTRVARTSAGASIIYWSSVLLQRWGKCHVVLHRLTKPQTAKHQYS